MPLLALLLKHNFEQQAVLTESRRIFGTRVDQSSPHVSQAMGEVDAGLTFGAELKVQPLYARIRNCLY